MTRLENREPLSRRLARGFFWSAAFTCNTSATYFLLNLGIARIIGKTGFGEWSILQSTTATVTGVAQLSMMVTATRYVARYRDTQPRKIGAVLGICSVVTLTAGLIVTLLIFFFPGEIADRVLHAPHLQNGVKLCSLYALFVTMNGFQIGALAGFELFRHLAFLSLLYGVGSLSLVLLLAMKHGLTGGLLGLGLAAFGNWFVHHVVLRRVCQERGVRTSFSEMRNELGVLKSFALPGSLAGLSSSASVWLSNLILVRLPGGFSEMAIVAAANLFKSIILFAPSIGSSVALPILSNLTGARHELGRNTTFSKYLISVTGAAILVALPIMLFPSWFLSLFGHGYYNGAPVVIIFCLTAIFEAVRDAISQKLLSSGWMWWGFTVYASRGILVVVLSQTLARSLGARGVALAHLAGSGVALILTHLVLSYRSSAPFFAIRSMRSYRSSL